jgi:hypothetical protein
LLRDDRKNDPFETGQSLYEAEFHAAEFPLEAPNQERYYGKNYTLHEWHRRGNETLSVEEKADIAFHCIVLEDLSEESWTVFQQKECKSLLLATRK